MKILRTIAFVFFALGINGSFAQTEKLFDAPSESFSNIKIQLYNSLPRFGILEGGLYDSSKQTKINRKTYDSINTEITKDYRRYFSLVELFFLSKSYSNITTGRLLSVNDIKQNRGDNDLRLSYVAQKHLLQTAPIISSTKAFDRYFRNPSDKSAILNFTPIWGGRFSDEFRQNDIYIEYVKNNIKTLNNWVFDFWKNDQQEAYLVTAVTFSSYDFESKGIWFNILDNSSVLDNCTGSFNYQGYTHNKFSSSIKSIKYLPEKSFENSIKRRPVLYEIDVKNAKKIIKNKSYFLVRKIKLNLLRVSYGAGAYGVTPEISLSYNIEDPLFRIYKTEDLTDLLAEFDYSKLTYK